MKTKTIQLKDGKVIETNTFEDGDIATICHDKVYESEERTGVNPQTGEQFKSKDYILGVKLEGKEEIKVKLTLTQAKKVKEVKSLIGKTIKAYSYENQYGTQIGVSVE